MTRKDYNEAQFLVPSMKYDVICHLHAEISRMTFFVKTAFIAHNWHIREQRRATARSVVNNHMATSSSHILFLYTKCDEKGLFVNTIQSGYDFLSGLLEYSACNIAAYHSPSAPLYRSGLTVALTPPQFYFLLNLTWKHDTAPVLATKQQSNKSYL